MSTSSFSHNRPARVLIVDDHPLVREGLTLRVTSQPDLQVCGEAATAEQALELIESTGPDVVIVDLQLGGSHGIDLLKDIKTRFPNIKTLVLSSFDESLYAERSLRAGALGYINKRECQEIILDAIRAVLAGDRYLSEPMTQRLLGQTLGSGPMPESDPVQRLSNRELEVFQLIGSGQTTRSVANHLGLSVHTIESHRENIRRKLSLKNGAELVTVAVQWVLEHGQ